MLGWRPVVPIRQGAPSPLQSARCDRTRRRTQCAKNRLCRPRWLGLITQGAALARACYYPCRIRPRRTAPMKRIGIIVAGSAYPMDGFKSGLRDLGWVEGEGVSFEIRAAEGQLQRLPEFASEMVSLGVDLIAVIGAVTVRAVRKATSTIPIVFAVVVEPIGDGLATNLAHPGGNVTGVTTF
ncbi:hypothetical protein FXV83_23175 [Bradyrhizobium hipponense]|uniref:ABC transporter substrate-binding protein n=2 Tax=Bradyrhizobium hipponense TaxID=2605638 RepID=A0A5S4YJP2_9BRAD|nr:hypothetical protein FXV83_23175 [Bradyrhizobium hipponense]